MDVLQRFFLFVWHWRFQPRYFYCTRKGKTHTTHTVYTQCDATTLLDILIWIRGSERLHHSCLPCCPCHQFSLHGYGPEWHQVSCFLLSLFFLSTVNTSIVQELNVPVLWYQTTSMLVLIPEIFLCTLPLWHCHSIVLHLCGQGYFLWALSSPVH